MVFADYIVTARSELHKVLFLALSVTFFYSARNARIASAVLATAIPSVCPSVRPSVRHTPVLCQNDGT